MLLVALLSLTPCPTFAGPTAEAVQEPPAPTAQEPWPQRAQAWRWHRAEPSAAELLAAWEDADRGLWIAQAAARGLRGQEALGPLLDAVVDASDSEQAPPAEILELLNATPDAALRQATWEARRQAPYWREPATVALLRAGAGPEVLDGFPTILETALLAGWRPQLAQWPALLAKPEWRARLWPQIVGEAISPEAAAALRRVDTTAWPAGDRLLLTVLLADAAAPRPELALQLWNGWLREPLPEQAGIALQEALGRHLPAIEPEALRVSLDSAEPTRQVDALRLLALLAPPPAADLLRDTALATEQDTGLRAQAVQAVFRCGSDSHIQAIAALLQADTPQPVLQALLAGMRFRPAADLSRRLEAMLPRLRTRLASLAVELVILTGDEATRLRWLPRVAALPRTDQLRIVQAAWARGSSPGVLSWMKDQARATDPDAARRGRVGLQTALPPAEVAAFYREALAEAPDLAARLRLLGEVRELRTDAALELIVDWLATVEGREHPSSGSWASLLVEEPAARRACHTWWPHFNRLTAVQRDWAAASLAAELPAARAYLRERIPAVDPPTRLRMLTALTSGPEAADAELALGLIDASTEVDAIRACAAWVVAERSTSDPDWASRARAALLDAARQQLQAPPGPGWRALVRRWGLRPPYEHSREDLRAELGRELPRLWWNPLSIEFARGQAEDGDAERCAAAAWEAWLDALEPSTLELAEEGSRAESLLATQLPSALVALTLAGAAESGSLDAQLAQSLRESPRVHPDLLAVTARALESAYPQAAHAARERLRATEAPDSWRWPPTEDESLAWSHPWLVVDDALFAAVETRLFSADPAVDRALEIATRRRPRDRRAHLWRGWRALEQERLAEARAAFTLADDCSGWLPYARMEPQLGLALTAWQDSGSLAELEALLVRQEQAAKLLPLRLAPERASALSAARGD